MARILIRAKTNGPGPDDWQRGQVVAIVADGWEFSHNELSDRFQIIDVSGPPENWGYLTARAVIGTNLELGEAILSSRPKIRIDIDALIGRPHSLPEVVRTRMQIDATLRPVDAIAAITTVL